MGVRSQRYLVGDKKRYGSQFAKRLVASWGCPHGCTVGGKLTPFTWAHACFSCAHPELIMQRKVYREEVAAAKWGIRTDGANTHSQLDKLHALLQDPDRDGVSMQVVMMPSRPAWIRACDGGDFTGAVTDHFEREVRRAVGGLFEDAGGNKIK